MKFVKYGRENNSGNYSCPSSLSNYDFTDVSNTQSETNENKPNTENGETATCPFSQNDKDKKNPKVVVSIQSNEEKAKENLLRT